MRILGAACLTMALLAAPAAAEIPPAPSPAPTGDGANGCGGSRQVLIVPLAATHIAPPYPAEAQRLGEQGTSLLHIALNPDGTVLSDSLTRSSGSARLDDAALDFVKQNWRWQPVDCRRPINIQVSVVWALHDGDPNPFAANPALLAKVMTFVLADAGDYPAGSVPKRAMTMVVVIVGADGALGTAALLRSSGDKQLDDKSVEIVRSRHQWAAPRMDGKGVGGMMMVGVIWTPPGQTPPDPEQIAPVLQLLAPPAAP